MRQTIQRKWFYTAAALAAIILVALVHAAYLTQSQLSVEKNPNPPSPGSYSLGGS